MLTSIYNTPSDCLKPGDVRAMKRLDGLASLEDGETLMAYDWTQAGTPIPNAPGSSLATFIPPLQDATVVATPGVGLQLNPAPQPFIQSVDQAGNLTIPAITLPFGPVSGFFDRLKYLVYSPAGPFPPAPTDGYPAPADGREFIAVFEIAGRQTYASPTKFPVGFSANVLNLGRDPRMCVPGVCIFDPASFLFCDTLFTNDTIYAGYGRRPFLKPSWGGPGPDYLAFEANIPIARRNFADPLSDFANIQMAYNRKEGYVRWVLNGVELFRVSELGYPVESRWMVSDLGGPPQKVAPAFLKAGFALYAPLDGTRPLDLGPDPGAPNAPLVAQLPAAPWHFSPVNVVGGNGPTAGDPLPLAPGDYVDGASLLANRLFGQGAQSIIRSMSVVVL